MTFGAEKSSKALAAESALIGVAVVWGLTFVMVKDAVAAMPVMTFLAYRFLAACVIVVPAVARRLPQLGRSGLKWGLLMGAFLTGGYVLQTFGLRLTSASHAGFITGMFVVLTPLFGIALGHRPGRLGWGAAAVATVGLWLLAGPGGGGDALGDALVLGCAASFSLHILATDRAVRSHDIAALLVVQLGVCALVSLIAAGALGDLVVPPNAQVWTALVVTSVGATALAFFIQSYAQKHASPARTSLILASEPAFAGLFAYLLAGESLNARGWAGAALIMAAIVAVEVVPRLRPSRPLPEG